MADGGLTTRIPIWVGVSGTIALVLVGMIVSSMLLGSSSGAHGSGDGSDPAENPAQFVTVAMEDNAFEPVEIEVERGALVRLQFENTGAVLHDFTIDEIPIEDLRYTIDGMRMTVEDVDEHADHLLDSAIHLPLEPGSIGVIEFRATELGEYEFYCAEPEHRDAGMFGVIRVVTPPAEQPPPIEGGRSDDPRDHTPSDAPDDHTPSTGPGDHAPSDRRGH